MRLYLADAYSEERERAELQDPARITLVAEMDGTLAAYAQMRDGIPPPCVTGERPWEILRFYVDREFHGRGLAHELMRVIDSLAIERGVKTLWLGVWEHNDRAIAFYKKFGFRRVGEQPFILGTDRQTDWVMERML